ncbi:MAG: autotransporter outer membrane beta-barrel domain-containing protein [Opitutaceae bacterium]|nr:autotransporter outer membrane beta-barrel domain-containing protein [Opitutaceae bacterium]
MQTLAALPVTVNGETLDGPRQTLGLAAQGGALALSISSGPSLDLTWAAAAGGAWNYTGTNWAAAGAASGDTTFASWDRVRFTDAAAGAVTLANTAYVSDLHVSGTGAHVFDGAHGITAAAGRQTGGAFDGAGKLYKHDSGTLSFQNTGANVFQGGVDWHGGAIVIENGGQLGGGAVNIIGSGVLRLETAADAAVLDVPVVFDNPAAVLAIESNRPLDLAGAVSGAGNLVLGGAVALTGSSTHSGAVTLAAGAELSVSRDENLGSAAARLELAGDAALRVTGGFATARTITLNAHTLALQIDGAGALTLDRRTPDQFTGAGAVALSGRLHAAAENVLGGAVNWTVARDGRLDLSASQTVAGLVNHGAIAFLPPSAGAYRTLTAGSLAGSGTITLRLNMETNASDRLVILGEITGGQTLDLQREGGYPSRPRDLDIVLVNYAVEGSGARFSAPVIAFGIDAYTLRDDPQNKAVRLASNGLTNIGDAILATAGVLGLDWHYGLDSLHKRMGAFRVEAAPARPAAGGRSRNQRRDAAPGGDCWLRGNFYRLEAGRDLIGDAFYQDSYDLTAGVDKGFTAALGGAVYAGAFAAASQSQRNFENFGEGGTTGFGGGAYLAWLHKSGWYADLVGRFDKYTNRLTAKSSVTLAHARYRSTAAGGSVEIGRRIGLARRVWLEPSAQAAAAMVDGAIYTTDNGIKVAIDDSTVRQYRAQLRAGADFGLWMPYARAALLRDDTRGGLVRAANRRYAAGFDGDRVEFGAGVCWNVGRGRQAFVDYDYNKADHYKRPWAFNIGFRRNW